MRNLKLMVAASALALLSGAANAQSTASSEAGAEILAPITVTNTQELFFGQIIPSVDTIGNVVLAADGTRTCDAVLTCVGNTQTVATFTVSGIADAGFSVTLPTSVLIDDIDSVSGVNGTGVAMNVTAFTGTAASRTLDNLGQDVFTLGATLAVGANQEPGLYTGSYDVTVDYQ